MDENGASWVIAFAIIWTLWQILRIALGIADIAKELRRLREIAEGRQR